jgi:hypothetical protein
MIHSIPDLCLRNDDNNLTYANLTDGATPFRLTFKVLTSLIKKLLLFKQQNLFSLLDSKPVKFSVNEVTSVGGVTPAALHVATAFPNHSAQIGNVIKDDSISTNH